MIDRLTRPSASRGRIAAAAAAAALLLAPSTAAAEGWLDGPGFELGLPVSAADFGAAPDGSSTAAWVTVGGIEAPALRVQHAAPDGALGPVQSLGAANTASPVVVATGANGRGAVLWVEPMDGGESDLKLALLTADGTAGPAQTVGTLATPFPDPTIEALDVAVDADGDATVAWWGTPPGGSDELLQLRRVAADGTLGPALPAAAPGSDPLPQVVAAPSGTAWVAWREGDAAHVARLGADGSPDSSAQVSAPGEVDGLALAAGGDGAVLAWEQSDDGGASHVQGVRLRASDDLVGTPFHGAEEPFGLASAPSAAIGPDGTATVAWTGGELAGPTPTMITRIARFAPGASTAAAQQLVPSQSGVFSGAAALGAAPDGSLLAAWVEGRAPPFLAVAARRIAPDGTLGPITRAGDALVAGGPEEILRPFPDANGGALLAIRNPLSGGVVRSLDAIAPVVTADVPATAVAGVPVQLSATATDRTAVDLWWDFGDESGSRRATPRHAFAAPGTYTVTFTATDAVDNATTVTRQVVVAPAGDLGPKPDTRRPQPEPAPAALKVTKATRAGAKVSVAGTIARAASGRVTIAVSKRVGRRTVTVRTSARIANGRWRATARLTRALARTRGSLRLVVRYAGDSDVRAASAARTVRAAGARAGKPKPKRGKR